MPIKSTPEQEGNNCKKGYIKAGYNSLLPYRPCYRTLCTFHSDKNNLARQYDLEYLLAQVRYYLALFFMYLKIYEKLAFEQQIKDIREELWAGVYRLFLTRFNDEDIREMLRKNNSSQYLFYLISQKDILFRNLSALAELSHHIMQYTFIIKAFIDKICPNNILPEEKFTFPIYYSWVDKEKKKCVVKVRFF